MLAGLSPLELGRLRMSVGYGSHKKGRLLSPIEIGFILQKACEQGASLDDCAAAIKIGTSQVGRFISILSLPQDIQHLVDWGAGNDFVGFSAAVELARLKDVDDQRAVARSILTDGLNSKEVRQVGQLRVRSGRTISACIKEILGMRPTIEKRYVFIGSLSDQNVEEALHKLTQMERDAILKSVVERLGVQGVSSRLGQRFFTLVGDKRFNEYMHNIGKENIEAQLQTQIKEAIENVLPNC